MSDEVAIQARINALRAQGGGCVDLPAGTIHVSAPLVLPRTGTTPQGVVTMRGAGIRATKIEGAADFPVGRAMIEWEPTVARTWHQRISDLCLRLPDVPDTRAVHYQRVGREATIEAFNAERMQLAMEDVLIEGNNDYHASLIDLEGQVFVSSFERVYGDNSVGNLGSDAHDTVLFQFETDLFGASISSDIAGLSYSTISGCVAGSLRRGGRGCLIRGRVKETSIRDCWVDGTRQNPGVYLVNSFGATISNVNNEGRSGAQVYIKDCRGIRLNNITLSSQDPEWPDWHPSTTYAVGAAVIKPGWRAAVTDPPPANNCWYRAIARGTSGVAEPSWPTTVSERAVDGTVTWECMGPAVQDAVTIDGGADITLTNFPTDPAKPTFTARGCKAIRLINKPTDMHAERVSVPGDPLDEVAWNAASGVGRFIGARGGEHVAVGVDAV